MYTIREAEVRNVFHGISSTIEAVSYTHLAQAKEFVEFEAAHPEVKIGICLQNRLNRTTVELKKIASSANDHALMALALAVDIYVDIHQICTCLLYTSRCV